jgi:alpha-glucosidase (family GH31 glycosyl hydrolase)
MNFSANFANPCDWIAQVRAQGLEFMTWTSSAFFGDTPLPRHLPGSYTYADLSDPATWAAYQQALAQQHACGVRGHKMDRADEHFPRDENWADASVRPGERRNRYAWLFARVHDEALRAAWGEDSFSFARAAIHRSQPQLGAIWGGDPRSNWEGLRGNLANAMRAGFMGFPVWGSDVGGYLGEGYIDPELYLRWMQFGVFSGFMEVKLDGAGGAGPDRMPWRYDEDFQSAYRELLFTRMTLLPYLYSLANTSARNGVMMQPMAYRHLDDPQAHAIWDQYYLGQALLVAPLVAPGGEREVYLPAGRWRAWFDGAGDTTWQGPTRIRWKWGVEELPLFVRDNSLFVTGDYPLGNAVAWRGERPTSLELHAIPGQPGESASFDLVDPWDDNRVKTFTLRVDERGVHVDGPAVQFSLTVTVHPHTPGQNTRSEEFEPGEAIDFTSSR